MAEVQSVLQHLCPRIVCYATKEINDTLQQTVHLPDVATLLKPWQATAVERVQLRSSSFEVIHAASFPLDLQPADRLHAEGAYEHAGGWLDDVGQAITEKTPNWLEEVGNSEDLDSHKTPWYNFFLEKLLEIRPMTTCDTFGHPMACLLVTSVNHPEPLNALAELYSATSPPNFMADKVYVDPSFLRYYAVLHDVRNTDLTESQALLEQIRRAYGVHCALLPFNSFDPEAPPPLEGKKDTRPPIFDTLWQPFLPKEPTGKVQGLGEKDVLAFRIFLRDMAVMSLIPWMERSVQQWNETLALNRKGITGRLFSAGRKYFGATASGRSSPSGHPVPGYDATRRLYPFQSQEAQTRRLADVAFMIRDYKLAASTYEMFRKDCINDRAWRDAAQAARLTGLSYLMQALLFPSQLGKRTDGDTFLEQAHSLAFSSDALSAGAVSLDDLKMTCLYKDLYQAAGEIRQAPISLCRCAGEIEEVSAAMLLEQAAVCEFKMSKTGHRRKAAFHLAMAAQRYEKTGHKRLAGHCLVKAARIYETRITTRDSEKAFDPIFDGTSTWKGIERHLTLALGRQAANLGPSDEALMTTLAISVNGDGAQSIIDADSDLEESDNESLHPFISVSTASGMKEPFQKSQQDMQERLRLEESESDPHFTHTAPPLITNPILCSIQAPAEYTLTTENGFESISIAFNLRNSSSNSVADYKLSLLRRPSVQSTTEACRWTGRTSFTGTLAPSDSIEISARIVASHPCAVNIGRWTLDVGLDREENGTETSEEILWQVVGSEQMLFIL